jgi:hypothetical protein
MRRLVALGAIRVVGLVVAVVAGAVGVAGAIVTAVGPEVWIAGPDGAGSFVALPLPLRIAHAVAVLVTASSVAVLALAVSRLAWRVRREAAFVPALTRAMAAIAGIVIVGSWLSRIAASVAAHAGVDFGDGDPSTVDASTAPIDWGIQPGTFAPDLPLLGIGITFALCAVILRSAERMQRDTEGLV